jgi:hypothetical protein
MSTPAESPEPRSSRATGTIAALAVWSIVSVPNCLRHTEAQTQTASALSPSAEAVLYPPISKCPCTGTGQGPCTVQVSVPLEARLNVAVLALGCPVKTAHPLRADGGRCLRLATARGGLLNLLPSLFVPLQLALAPMRLGHDRSRILLIWDAA